jgi:hypothetical protein
MAASHCMHCMIRWRCSHKQQRQQHLLVLSYVPFMPLVCPKPLQNHYVCGTALAG